MLTSQTEINEFTLVFFIVTGLISFIFAGLGAWLASYLNYRYYLKTEIHRLENEYKQYLKETQEKTTREVLDQVWRKYQEALGSVAAIYSGSVKYPNLNRMTEDELRQFLEETHLNEYQKSKVMEASDRNRFYSEILHIFQMERVIESINNFHNELVNNKLFIPDDIYEVLMGTRFLLSKSFSSYEIGSEVEDIELLKEGRQYFDEAKNKNEEIETKLKKLMHYDQESTN